MGTTVRQIDAATGTLSASVATLGRVPTSVAADGAGTIVVLSAVYLTTSSDAGVTWTTETLATQGTSVLTSFTGLCFNAQLGTYIAAGEDGAAGGPVLAQSLRTN